MKVYILEDNIERILFFRKKLEKHDLYITDSVEDFIHKLEEGKPDFAFLDHDLDGRVFVSIHEPNTGSALARYISGTDLKIDTIVIHSHNQDGARYMADILKSHTDDLIVMPFSMLMERLE